MSDILKDWKIHLLVLAIVIIAEFIGIRKVAIGPGTALFLPMLYALVIGILLGPRFLKIVTDEEMERASPLIGISVMLLSAKYGTTIGPAIPTIVKAGAALIFQELGNLGTIFLGLPVAVALGLKREAVGATFSIAREGSLAIVADVFGLDGPEGRGVMGVYICGTLFGAIYFGLMAGFFASLGWFSAKALGMACGVGSASMMAASSGALVAALPNFKDDILAFAAASNLLTGATGLYASLFLGLPLTEWLYRTISGDRSRPGQAKAEPRGGEGKGGKGGGKQ